MGNLITINGRLLRIVDEGPVWVRTSSTTYVQGNESPESISLLERDDRYFLGKKSEDGEFSIIRELSVEEAKSVLFEIRTLQIRHEVENFFVQKADTPIKEVVTDINVKRAEC